MKSGRRKVGLLDHIEEICTEYPNNDFSLIDLGPPPHIMPNFTSSDETENQNVSIASVVEAQTKKRAFDLFGFKRR